MSNLIEIPNPNQKQKDWIGAKKGRNSGLTLTINCTILYLWFDFSLNYAVLTMICKIFCFKSAFRVIRPINFRPIIFSAFWVFGLFYFVFLTFDLMSFGLMLQNQNKKNSRKRIATHWTQEPKRYRKKTEYLKIRVEFLY